MRGRKPASIVAGTSTAVDVPKPPTWLSKDARAEWKRVTAILVERRILSDADLGTLESYVTATGQVRECQRLLNIEGLVVETKAGKRKHPALAIQNAAMTTARLCAAELGLTPVSRSRPAVRDDDADLAFLG